MTKDELSELDIVDWADYSEYFSGADLLLERVVNFSASFVMLCLYLRPLLDRGRLISWNESLTRLMSVTPNGRLSRRI
jgi:hypothetical protein